MSVELNPHNYTNMNFVFSQFLVADFFKKESRSPRGFLPRPLLRAGESIAPPPLPQKNSGGAHHFRFRFLDLCIRFGKMISKVCEGFNSGASTKMGRIAPFLYFPGRQEPMRFAVRRLYRANSDSRVLALVSGLGQVLPGEHRI